MLCRYKWDNNEKHLKPETGLLQIRAGLGVFANLRPAAVLPQVYPTPTLVQFSAIRLISIIRLNSDIFLVALSFMELK